MVAKVSSETDVFYPFFSHRLLWCSRKKKTILEVCSWNSCMSVLRWLLMLPFKQLKIDIEKKPLRIILIIDF